MPILYSLVARGSVVLAEFSLATGNASSVARRILETIASHGERTSFIKDSYVFHILRDGNFVYLCMADQLFGRRIPFAFLEDIQSRFMKDYANVAQTALAYAMNDAFSRVLAQRMDFFSNDPNSDVLNRIKGEINEVKGVMLDNIDKILDRGEKVDLLVEKTTDLEENTFVFKKDTKALSRVLWYKNVKLLILMCVVILFIFFIIIATMCGGLSFPNC